MPVDLLRQTVIRWNDPDPQYMPLLHEGGITAVLTSPNEGFEKACAAVGIEVVHESDVQFIGLADAAKAGSGSPVIFRAGLWPGVHPLDASVASATRGVWIDQNCYLVECLRALYPKLPRCWGICRIRRAACPRNGQCRSILWNWRWPKRGWRAGTL